MEEILTEEEPKTLPKKDKETLQTLDIVFGSNKYRDPKWSVVPTQKDKETLQTLDIVFGSSAYRDRKRRRPKTDVAPTKKVTEPTISDNMVSHKKPLPEPDTESENMPLIVDTDFNNLKLSYQYAYDHFIEAWVKAVFTGDTEEAMRIVRQQLDRSYNASLDVYRFLSNHTETTITMISYIMAVAFFVCYGWSIYLAFQTLGMMGVISMLISTVFKGTLRWILSGLVKDLIHKHISKSSVLDEVFDVVVQLIIVATGPDQLLWNSTSLLDMTNFFVRKNLPKILIQGLVSFGIEHGLKLGSKDIFDLHKGIGSDLTSMDYKRTLSIMAPLLVYQFVANEDYQNEMVSQLHFYLFQRMGISRLMRFATGPVAKQLKSFEFMQRGLAKRNVENENAFVKSFMDYFFGKIYSMDELDNMTNQELLMLVGEDTPGARNASRSSLIRAIRDGQLNRLDISMAILVDLMISAQITYMTTEAFKHASTLYQNGREKMLLKNVAKQMAMDRKDPNQLDRLALHRKARKRDKAKYDDLSGVIGDASKTALANIAIAAKTLSTFFPQKQSDATLLKDMARQRFDSRIGPDTTDRKGLYDQVRSDQDTALLKDVARQMFENRIIPSSIGPDTTDRKGLYDQVSTDQDNALLKDMARQRFENRIIPSSIGPDTIDRKSLYAQNVRQNHLQELDTAIRVDQEVQKKLQDTYSIYETLVFVDKEDIEQIKNFDFGLQDGKSKSVGADIKAGLKDQLKLARLKSDSEKLISSQKLLIELTSLQRQYLDQQADALRRQINANEALGRATDNEMARLSKIQHFLNTPQESLEDTLNLLVTFGKQVDDRIKSNEDRMKHLYNARNDAVQKEKDKKAALALEKQLKEEKDMLRNVAKWRAEQMKQTKAAAKALIQKQNLDRKNMYREERLATEKTAKKNQKLMKDAAKWRGQQLYEDEKLKKASVNNIKKPVAEPDRRKLYREERLAIEENEKFLKDAAKWRGQQLHEENERLKAIKKPVVEPDRRNMHKLAAAEMAISKANAEVASESGTIDLPQTLQLSDLLNVLDLDHLMDIRTMVLEGDQSTIYIKMKEEFPSSLKTWQELFFDSGNESNMDIFLRIKRIQDIGTSTLFGSGDTSASSSQIINAYRHYLLAANIFGTKANHALLSSDTPSSQFINENAHEMTAKYVQARNIRTQLIDTYLKQSELSDYAAANTNVKHLFESISRVKNLKDGFQVLEQMVDMERQLPSKRPSVTLPAHVEWGEDGYPSANSIFHGITSLDDLLIFQDTSTPVDKFVHQLNDGGSNGTKNTKLSTKEMKQMARVLSEFGVVNTDNISTVFYQIYNQFNQLGATHDISGADISTWFSINKAELEQSIMKNMEILGLGDLPFQSSKWIDLYKFNQSLEKRVNFLQNDPFFNEIDKSRPRNPKKDITDFVQAFQRIGKAVNIPDNELKNPVDAQVAILKFRIDATRYAAGVDNPSSTSITTPQEFEGVLKKHMGALFDEYIHLYFQIHGKNLKESYEKENFNIDKYSPVDIMTDLAEIRIVYQQEKERLEKLTGYMNMDVKQMRDIEKDFVNKKAVINYLKTVGFDKNQLETYPIKTLKRLFELVSKDKDWIPIPDYEKQINEFQKEFATVKDDLLRNPNFPEEFKLLLALDLQYANFVPPYTPKILEAHMNSVADFIKANTITKRIDTFEKNPYTPLSKLLPLAVGAEAPSIPPAVGKHAIRKSDNPILDDLYEKLSLIDESKREPFWSMLNTLSPYELALNLVGLNLQIEQHVQYELNNEIRFLHQMSGTNLPPLPALSTLGEKRKWLDDNYRMLQEKLSRSINDKIQQLPQNLVDYYSNEFQNATTLRSLADLDAKLTNEIKLGATGLTVQFIHDLLSEIDNAPTDLLEESGNLLRNVNNATPSTVKGFFDRVWPFYQAQLLSDISSLNPEMSFEDKMQLFSSQDKLSLYMSLRQYRLELAQKQASNQIETEWNLSKSQRQFFLDQVQKLGPSRWKTVLEIGKHAQKLAGSRLWVDLDQVPSDFIKMQLQTFLKKTHEHYTVIFGGFRYEADVNPKTKTLDNSILYFTDESGKDVKIIEKSGQGGYRHVTIGSNQSEEMIGTSTKGAKRRQVDDIVIVETGSSGKFAKDLPKDDMGTFKNDVLTEGRRTVYDNDKLILDETGQWSETGEFMNGTIYQVLENGEQTFTFYEGGKKRHEQILRNGLLHVLDGDFSIDSKNRHIVQGHWKLYNLQNFNTEPSALEGKLMQAQDGKFDISSGQMMNIDPVAYQKALTAKMMYDDEVLKRLEEGGDLVYQPPNSDEATKTYYLMNQQAFWKKLIGAAESEKLTLKYTPPNPSYPDGQVETDFDMGKILQYEEDERVNQAFVAASVVGGVGTTAVLTASSLSGSPLIAFVVPALFQVATNTLNALKEGTVEALAEGTVEDLAEKDLKDNGIDPEKVKKLLGDGLKKMAENVEDPTEHILRIRQVNEMLLAGDFIDIDGRKAAKFYGGTKNHGTFSARQSGRGGGADLPDIWDPLTSKEKVPQQTFKEAIGRGNENTELLREQFKFDKAEQYSNWLGSWFAATAETLVDENVRAVMSEIFDNSDLQIDRNIIYNWLQLEAKKQTAIFLSKKAIGTGVKLTTSALAKELLMNSDILSVTVDNGRFGGMGSFLVENVSSVAQGGANAYAGYQFGTAIYELKGWYNKYTELQNSVDDFYGQVKTNLKLVKKLPQREDSNFPETSLGENEKKIVPSESDKEARTRKFFIETFK